MKALGAKRKPPARKRAAMGRVRVAEGWDGEGLELGEAVPGEGFDGDEVGWAAQDLAHGVVEVGFGGGREGVAVGAEDGFGAAGFGPSCG